jgi:hypothetical protein
MPPHDSARVLELPLLVECDRALVEVDDAELHWHAGATISQSISGIASSFQSTMTKPARIPSSFATKIARYGWSTASRAERSAKETMRSFSAISSGERPGR